MRIGIIIPSGKLMTTQFFRKAMVIAWSNMIDFPLPLSPTIILRMLRRDFCSSLISLNNRPYSRVSRRTSIAGLLKSPQFCVLLNAFTIRNWLTIETVKPTTWPCNCSSPTDSTPNSGIFSTAMALLLLRTILLRRAARSPIAALLVLISLGFFFFKKVAGVPFLVSAFLRERGFWFSFFATRLTLATFCTGAEVVNDAERQTGIGEKKGIRDFEKHLQQVG